MGANILVVAAHPDDEVLGCGGTIARHAAAGDNVSVFIAAEGATSRDSARNAKARSRDILDLREAARRAAAILGARILEFGDFPDNRMDTVPLLDVVKKVESVISRVKPSVVYTHHGCDLNIDHRVLHQAVVTSCRPMPKQCVTRLFFFEVMSSTEWQTPGAQPAFSPTWFVDISRALVKKRKALGAYRKEMRPWPHARSFRSIESLARYRGASVGVEAAEAFVLGRGLSR